MDGAARLPGRRSAHMAAPPGARSTARATRRRADRSLWLHLGRCGAGPLGAGARAGASRAVAESGIPFGRSVCVALPPAAFADSAWAGSGAQQTVFLPGLCAGNRRLAVGGGFVAAPAGLSAHAVVKTMGAGRAIAGATAVLLRAGRLARLVATNGAAKPARANAGCARQVACGGAGRPAAQSARGVARQRLRAIRHLPADGLAVACAAGV